MSLLVLPAKPGDGLLVSGRAKTDAMPPFKVEVHPHFRRIRQCPQGTLRSRFRA
jgi:hypothetical protein